MINGGGDEDNDDDDERKDYKRRFGGIIYRLLDSSRQRFMGKLICFFMPNYCYYNYQSNY